MSQMNEQQMQISKAFRKETMNKLHEHLTSLEHRYTDNSVKYYRTSPTERESARKELSFPENIPTPADYIKENQENINLQLALKSLLYDLLEDEKSKELLVLIALFELLGDYFVKFPYHTEKNYEQREELEKKYKVENINKELQEKFNEFKLMGDGTYYSSSHIHLFNFPQKILLSSKSLDIFNKQNIQLKDISLICSSDSLYNTFYFPNYVYENNNTYIDVEIGDHVLDCGGAYGDTAIIFASKVGATGKVISFEPFPKEAKIFKYNQALNPSIANRITLIPAATSKENGSANFLIHSLASKIVEETRKENTITVPMVTIDFIVEKYKWKKLDFIKMDIEGAELNSLIGAVHSIKRFRPKLAISLYHKPEDYYTIPHFINKLDLAYQFYLEHYYVNRWETVLYAVVEDK